MNIYTILIADDHPIFLKGLSMMLNEVSEFKVIGEVSNGKEMLEMLDMYSDSLPDVVITDIKMPGLDGIEATRRAIERFPSLNIIALTMFGEHKYLKMMAEVGAKGFLQKSVTRDELEKAIKSVCNGNAYFSNEIMSDLASVIPRKEQAIFIEELNEHFTFRELKVLKLIVKGLSSQEIADEMFISPRTVEGHRANLIGKTGTKNMVDLAIYAIRNHLVEI